MADGQSANNMIVLLLGAVLLVIAVLAFDGWNALRSRRPANRVRRRAAKCTPVVDRRKRQLGGRRRNDMHRSTRRAGDP